MDKRNSTYFNLAKHFAAFSIFTLVFTDSIDALEPDPNAVSGTHVALSKALTDFNFSYPDNNPLTEEEVIAAIRNMKSTYPEMSDEMFEFFQQVVDKRVLPEGMEFQRSDSLISHGYFFEVDWKDLVWKTPTKGKPHPELGWGFTLRIRERFISSREMTDEEKAEMERRNNQRASQRRQRVEKPAQDVRIPGFAPVVAEPAPDKPFPSGLPNTVPQSLITDH